jgi:signal transduction histidine kinase/DNA-binding response OmpR family regulator
MNKGHDMELDWVSNTENHKIVEVEARYNDEKKVQQIAKQVQQRNGLLVIGLLILLFAAALSYYYVKLRKANDITQKQEAQLRTLDMAKSRFFANISHELRTPLTLILGPLSTLLKNETLNNVGLTHAQLAQSNAQNLLKLVNEILDLSKLESGKMKIQETTVRFQPFISRLVSAFESHAEYLGIHYQLEYKAAERLRLDLDAEKTTQIVNNLLSNALKFTPRGGSVSVKIEDLSNVMRLTVSDTGRGIHPDDLPHVFNRFYQTNQVDAAIEGGTGIGLALCRELVDVMEGRIWVESELGRGSQFYVEFPKKEVLGVGNDELGITNFELGINHVEESEIPKIGNELQFENVPNTERGVVTGLGSLHSSTETILIVEDNRDLRTYIADILRGSNYTVLETENGREALNLLQTVETKNQLPQLILSDIMMPVIDGFQLLKILKDTPAFQQIPVVMLTARADIRDKLTALRIGVDDYLLKPFDAEELVTRIQNLLKNKAIREKEVIGEVAGSGNLESSPNLTPPLISEPDRVWLENFEQFVQKNFTSNVLSVSMLAETFFMSESTLLRQLKRLTGLTPVQYLQEIRLNEARHLLENRVYDSIAQVASKVGYSDTRSFSRSFKQRFGKLPSDLLIP